MKIAVIVPAYNVEKYLGQCLDSILAQTYPSIEIYCCDDGSSDSTWKVLKEYAEKNPLIHAFNHSNKGMVATYNRLLLELADDIEAIGFVDSDDYIHPEMYERLANALEKYNADVVECGMVRVDTNSVQPSGTCSPGDVWRVIDDMSIYWLRRTSIGQWINKNNKLYRRATIKLLKFRNGLDFEDDFFFNCEVNAVANRKVLLCGNGYAYRSNPTSLNGLLNCRKYFNSVSERIRLNHEVFLNSGRVPIGVEEEYRKDIAKDAYRMMIRKNLKKNKNAKERKELFLAASDYFDKLERNYGFKAMGLNPIQHLIYRCCRTRKYFLAQLLVLFT